MPSRVVGPNDGTDGSTGTGPHGIPWTPLRAKDVGFAACRHRLITSYNLICGGSTRHVHRRHAVFALDGYLVRSAISLRSSLQLEIPRPVKLKKISPGCFEAPNHHEGCCCTATEHGGSSLTHIQSKPCPARRKLDADIISLSD